MLFSYIKQHKKIFFLGLGFIILASASYVGYHFRYLSQQEDSSPLTKAPEIVKGKIVTLKLLKEDYFIDFHNMWSQDVRHFIEYPEFINLEFTLQYLKKEMEKLAQGQELVYCIFDNKADNLIGALDIREKNDCGQFGCWLNERFRGGGRIQEAIKLITNIYFRLYNKQSFIAHVRLWNTRSYKALLKAGFTDTGTFYYENGKPTRYILEFHRKK
jgi:RimJ/RimL family protein N-acetyltransferase